MGLRHQLMGLGHWVGHSTLTDFSLLSADNHTFTLPTSCHLKDHTLPRQLSRHHQIFVSPHKGTSCVNQYSRAMPPNSSSLPGISHYRELYAPLATCQDIHHPEESCFGKSSPEFTSHFSIYCSCALLSLIIIDTEETQIPRSGFRHLSSSCGTCT